MALLSRRPGAKWALAGTLADIRNAAGGDRMLNNSQLPPFGALRRTPSCPRRRGGKGEKNNDMK